MIARISLLNYYTFITAVQFFCNAADSAVRGPAPVTRLARSVYGMDNDEKVSALMGRVRH